jgi:ribosomal protein S18 acetylase RimI-like enzyme
MNSEANALIDDGNFHLFQSVGISLLDFFLGGSAIQYQQLVERHLKEAGQVIVKTLLTSVDNENDIEALAEYQQLFLETAKDGLSVVAVDNKTGKVVGVVLNKLLTKLQPFFENFQKTFNNPKSLGLLDFMVKIHNVFDLFDHCRVDCLMEISFLGTLPEYRKKGIAKNLCKMSVDLAEKLYNGVNVKKGIDGKNVVLEPVPQGVSAIFVPISQRIGRGLGFEVAVQLSTKEIEEIVGGPAGPETLAIVYKMLNKYV